MKKLFLTAFVLTLQLTIFAQAQPKREFRGAWIQCVNGQYLGKSPAQIRQMLASQLDVMQQAHVNAIIFQVRAEGDALYKSSYEPWSRYLTGQQGVAPSDGWDPLQWMIEQCHQRNMECHAWINPYRAKTKGTTQLAASHVAVRHPERVFKYGDLLIMNPAREDNRMFTLMVVEDILRRYDVDGIHMDDYFYPYPEAGEQIPDQSDFRLNPRGFANIGDWRRDNVNQLIKELHELVRNVKPWVKFGISPFGIYRNSPGKVNSPEGSATSGLQNYDDLYADVILWQKKGWVDYLIPQIYWNFGTKAADYEVLCHWWNDYAANRPLYIGQDVERTAKGVSPTNPQENQTGPKYRLQRSLKNVQGSCQWYAAAFVNNPGNYRSYLEASYHKYPALQPSMPFIDKKAPKRPRKVHASYGQSQTLISWQAPKGNKELDRAVSYVLYDFSAGQSINLDDPAHIIAITRANSIRVNGNLRGHTLILTALDRLQNESKGVKIKL